MNKALRLIVLSIALNCCCQISAVGQDNEPLINRRIDVSFKDSTLIYVVGQLSTINRIPSGFEKSPDQTEEVTLNIEMRNRSLRDVLDSIVQQVPSYRWEEIDGVINLTPNKGRCRFVELLLDLPIKRFMVPTARSKFEIRDTILDLVEVRDLLASNKIAAERLYYPNSPSIYTNDDIELSMSNTNVREVLNKVIRESEHKMWVIDMYGDRKNKLLISF